jgi:hypothetical protein
MPRGGRRPYCSRLAYGLPGMTARKPWSGPSAKPWQIAGNSVPRVLWQTTCPSISRARVTMDPQPAWPQPPQKPPLLHGHGQDPLMWLRGAVCRPGAGASLADGRMLWGSRAVYRMATVSRPARAVRGRGLEGPRWSSDRRPDRHRILRRRTQPLPALAAPPPRQRTPPSPPQPQPGIRRRRDRRAAAHLLRSSNPTPLPHPSCSGSSACTSTA